MFLAFVEGFWTIYSCSIGRAQKCNKKLSFPLFRGSGGKIRFLSKKEGNQLNLQHSIKTVNKLADLDSKENLSFFFTENNYFCIHLY